MTKSLEFRWTVSKGRNTYGYNICSLWVDGVKVSSCNGGGYDMQGTAYAEWLQAEFQDRLTKPDIADQADWTIESEKTNIRKYTGDRIFYGMGLNIYKTSRRIVLDGGCGMDSMKRIAEAIGITLQYVRTKGKDNTVYLAEIKE